MGHANRRITDPGDEVAVSAARERLLFSEFLIAARQRAACSIDDIALVTKVPARHLEALEQGRIDELPRGVYRRAIIRTYASAVGLDASLVLERFAQVFGANTAFSEWQTVPAPARPRPTALVRQPAPAVAPATLVPPRRVVSTQPTRARQERIRARWAAFIVAGAVLGSLAAIFTLAFDGPSRPTGSSAAARVERNRTVTTTVPEVPTVEAPAPAVATPAPAVATPARVDSPVLQAGSAPIPVRRRPPVANASAPAADPLSPPAAAQLPLPTEIDIRLVITSNPAGARVTVDGVGWGVTPVTIRHLSPGVKVIRVTKDGYVGQEREVRLAEAGAVAAELTLAPRE